jgi:HSP20 family protein
MTARPKKEAAIEKAPLLEPFWSLSPFGATFGRLFEDFCSRRLPEIESGLLAPAMDIEESPDEFVVTLELPGLKKDEVKIQFENGVLQVSGEKKSQREEKKASWHRVERRYGSFCRTLTVPSGVDTQHLKAELRDGVLSIHLAKLEEAKPTSIPIE